MRANFALDYDVVTLQQAHKVYLMAYISADAVPEDNTRRAINLSLVIDRSGSMAGEKINYTRQAAQLLVQNLGHKDRLSIVTYNDAVETILPSENVVHKDLISQRIAAIKPGGTTNLSGGWLEGCTHVAQHMNDDLLNRVILMTDGLANRGITQADKLVEIARQKLSEGVSTTTMGLGVDFNEDLLMEIANAGGGAFYFIESPEVTPSIFQEELSGLLSLVGQNLSITLTRTPHVKSVRQLNAYAQREEGWQMQYRLGDVFADEVKALILELSVGPLDSTGEVEIASLRFAYDELNEHGAQHREWTLPVRVNVAAPDDQRPHKINVDVRKAVLLLKAAQARQAAVALADQRRFADAARTLRQMIEELQASGFNHDPEILDEINSLSDQASAMESGESQYDEYNRKSMSTQAFYTMASRHGETVQLRKRERARDTSDVVEHLKKAHDRDLGDGIVPTALRWEDKVFPLAGDLIRIGREVQNEIMISARGVSRFHCQLSRTGPKLYLEDLGSTNGTLINGRRLVGQYAVSVGDELMIGEAKLVFEAAAQ